MLMLLLRAPGPELPYVAVGDPALPLSGSAGGACCEAASMPANEPAPASTGGEEGATARWKACVCACAEAPLGVWAMVRDGLW